MARVEGVAAVEVVEGMVRISNSDTKAEEDVVDTLLAVVVVAAVGEKEELMDEDDLHCNMFMRKD